MRRYSLAAVAAALAATVSAHGNITSPPARVPGPAMVAACGQQAVDAVLKDGTIPLEDVTNPLPSCEAVFLAPSLSVSPIGRLPFANSQRPLGKL